MKWKPFLITAALLILIYPYSVADVQTNTAAAVKASWIDHFSKFIDWPNINDTTTTFVIKVIGNDDLDGFLSRIYDKRTIKNLPVSVEFIDSPEDIGFCHILYISANKRRDLPTIVTAVANSPVLTVGATTNYAERGVILNFYEESNKIRFECNVTASRENNLEVSFRLLELAKIVRQD